MAKKKLLKKISAAGAALAASAGLLLNGLFQDPADIAKKEAYVPEKIVSTVVTTAVPEEDEEEPDEDEKKEKKTFLSRLRAWILHLPLGLRVFVGIPLWAAGWAIAETGGFLFTTFISPNAGVILRWLLIAAAFAGIFILLSRILFPDKKLKEVLNGRTFALLAGGVILLAVLNGLVPFVWKDFEKYAVWFRLIGGGILVTALLAAVMIPRRRRKTA